MTERAGTNRILLIAPRWGHVYGRYGALSRRLNFHPPLGLCYLSAALRQHGYETRVIDAEAEGLDESAIAAVAAEGGYGYVCLGAATPIFSEAVGLGVMIKQQTGATVIIGGPHVTILRGEAAKDASGVEYFVCGEGEQTLPALVSALNAGQSFNDIKGLTVRMPDGSFADTGEAERVPDLDILPFPDRTCLRPENYLWSVPGRGNVPATSVMFSRGCPFECMFCSVEKMFSRKVRYRSAGNFMDELRTVVKTTEFRHFVFLDDTLTSSRERSAGLFDAIAGAGLGVTFEGETRASLVDAELVGMMKRAGIVRMNIGIESGDPDMLETIKTGVTLDDVRRSLALFKGAGMETRGTVIIGCPGETRVRALRTLRFVAGLKDLDQPYINIAMPYPGTRLRELALAGEGGVILHTRDYQSLKRYGHAIMDVNDMTAGDLVRLQSAGLRRAYVKPRRLWYNLKRAGLRAGLSNGVAFLKGIIG